MPPDLITSLKENFKIKYAIAKNRNLENGD